MIRRVSTRNQMFWLTPLAVLLAAGTVPQASGQGIIRSGETVWHRAAKQLPQVTINAQGSNRPISDFINAQGSTKVFYSRPPYTDLPDYAVGWTTGGCPGPFCPPYGSSRIAVVDYAGGANTYLTAHGYPSLNTTTAGFIAERPLPDGRAEVTVVLHTMNALTFISTWDSNLPSPPESAETNMRLFGSSVPDLLSDPTQRIPALAESELVLIFINPALGAPMPDLVKLFAFGAYPNLELLDIYFGANAVGTLPNGTPATASVLQIGLPIAPNVGDGGFITETVDITPPPLGAPLVITTNSLPNGKVGTAYSAMLTATGGIPPYNWQLIAGRLPIGLTLNVVTGQISGTPTNPADSVVTFKVTDGSSHTATAVLSITIAP